MILEAQPAIEQELNPWESAAHRFNEAAELLRLEDGMRKVLRQAEYGIDREHSGSVG